MRVGYKYGDKITYVENKDCVPISEHYWKENFIKHNLPAYDTIDARFVIVDKDTPFVENRYCYVDEVILSITYQ